MSFDLVEIPIDRFVRKLKYRLSDDKHKFAFFLGAGCSVSSGIPAAKELVIKWLKIFYFEETGKEASKNESEYKQWLSGKYPEFTEENCSKLYGKVIKDLFPHKAERKAEFERLIQNKDPAFGYGVLAQLVGNSPRGEYCNIILTTNFDDLVADALYIYSRRKPLVVAHESLTGFIRLTSKTPIVIKLHGDVILDIENTDDETKQIAEPLKNKLRDILKETGIIFIGYGGNDEGVLKILNGLPKDHIKNGVYWVNEQLPDNKEFLQWLRDREAIWVKVDDFDKLMLYLFNEFNLQNPDENRFKELMKNYFDTIKKLNHELKGDKEKEIINDLVKDTHWKFILESMKFLQTDPKRAENIILEGIQKYPNSTNLYDTYASFLVHQGEFEKAEKVFLKLIELSPRDTEYYNDYAFFLMDSRKDYDKSEKYFEKALDLDPTNANTASNYAAFLMDIRKDYKNAEEYYLKSLNLDQNNASLISRYAIFLTEIRKNYNKAEELFLKSLEIDPKDANIACDYAIFLAKSRKDNIKSEEYFKKSLELDPTDAEIVSKYATFLACDLKDMDKAEEYYLKSLELDPRNADNIGDFAIFLSAIKKDTEAEKHFLKTIELNPLEPNYYGNYSGFLLAVGNREKGKEFLQKTFDFLKNSKTDQSLLIECYFYRYAHFFNDPIQMKNDYERIISLLNQNIRSTGWNFSRNIERAKLDGHPHPELLESLAKQISSGR
jgi:protein O-mannosyl-transferase